MSRAACRCGGSGMLREISLKAMICVLSAASCSGVNADGAFVVGVPLAAGDGAAAEAAWLAGPLALATTPLAPFALL